MYALHHYVYSALRYYLLGEGDDLQLECDYISVFPSSFST